MIVTPSLLLHAKAVLASNATRPFARSSSNVFADLSTVIMSVHKHVNEVKELGASWPLDDPTSAHYALLLAQSWHITNPNDATPDLLTLTPDQLMGWLMGWQKRLLAWTSAQHLFETDASWKQLNSYLDRWYELLVHHQIPRGRGCAEWLKSHNVITTDTVTSFDQTFNRTIAMQ